MWRTDSQFRRVEHAMGEAIGDTLLKARAQTAANKELPSDGRSFELRGASKKNLQTYIPCKNPF